MTDLEFENILNNDIAIVERRLIELLPNCLDNQDVVVEAMKYSLLNGGKRLRPVFCLEFAKMCSCDRKDALDFACAVEYIHTYSLIHDDLPCMDDDDYRRGKPSCHKKFGEATALLAGDGLLTQAFQIIGDCDLSDSKKVLATRLLAQNSGVLGMIGGQVIDLKYESETPDLKQLLSVHRLKTGALISAACLLGCIAAGADNDKISAASRFAYNLGIAFQIKDDILDVVGNSEILGKPVGSDAENEKTTYVTLEGLEKAQSDVEKLTNSAINELSAFDNNEFVMLLAQKLVNRNK
ncbi:MAG: polyprenyl synthetase family protein [Eubacterium sp.]|uniref:polyprenyl synthetase family protein n=1 Tax=Eubacterium sp. TaxID=142586 RepID=UPI003A2A572C